MLLFVTTLSLIFIYCVMLYVSWHRERKRMLDMAAILPGPVTSGLPTLEIAALVVQCQVLGEHYKLDSYVLAYKMMLGFAQAYMDLGLARMWLGPEPVTVLFAADTIEPILTNHRVLNKAIMYKAFEPWIGQGLVTSKRGKWQVRRKILTPAFHFRILSDFLPNINKDATRLVNKLNQERYLYCHQIDIIPLVALCTLDTICETAMGIRLDCQSSENSPYVKALHVVGETALARVTRPWLWPDFMYYRTQFGRRFVKARNLMHAFSMQVIEERKKEWQDILREASSLSNDPSRKLTFEETLSLKFARKADKRMAFLDLLLHQHLVEETMSLEDIQEEVDTFMFAGHDTTAMNISWTLYMLGLHQDIQDRVRAEIDHVIGHSAEADSKPKCSQPQGEKKMAKLMSSDITTKHLRELKYLDQVIKETLRMWPSIPFTARQLTEDVKVGDRAQYELPKGSSCMIFTHALHHNPKYFVKPEIFDPERFSQEQTVKRHPFAYIPFSAGPRNCIGQKFAQMEVKIILTKLISNYLFESCEPIDKLNTVGELVLRPSSGLFVRIIPRFVSCDSISTDLI